MKKISVLLLVLFAWIGAKAQNPVIITQPYLFLKTVTIGQAPSPRLSFAPGTINLNNVGGTMYFGANGNELAFHPHGDTSLSAWRWDIGDTSSSFSGNHFYIKNAVKLHTTDSVYGKAPNGQFALVPFSAGGVSTVLGTTNRITSTGGANPIIDISSTFEALLEKVANKTATASTSTTTYPNWLGVENYVTSQAVVGANPTGTIGLTAINGSANTFTRSDASPALSQAIIPTWTGQHIFANGIVSSLTTTNIFIPSATAAVNETLTPYLFNSATNGFMRIGFGSTTSTTLTANSQYANVIIGSAPITTATTGTHNLFANMVINPIGTITAGGAIVSATANLYVGPSSSNSGSTNYSALFDGPVQMQNNFTVLGNTNVQALMTNGLVTMNGALSTSFGSSGQLLYLPGGNITDLLTSSGTTVPLVPYTSLVPPSYLANQTNITLTNAPTLYIAGAPTAGTNVTITNPYSLYINSGAIHLPGTSSQYVAGDGSLQTYGGGGSGITALTGDVTASGTGSVAATIASSVNLSGSPTTTTQTTADASTKIATDAFVQNNFTAQAVYFATGTFTGAGTSGSPFALGIDTSPTSGSGLPVTSGGVFTALGLKAPIASPTFTGTVTIPNGGVFGTPTSMTATNVTGLPISSGVSGLGTNVATFLATPSSANFFSAITDETGSGVVVGSNTPTLVTPVLGVATATSINKVAITAPATSATLTLITGSTLQTTGAFALNLTTTAASTPTFPTGSGTLPYLAGINTWTNTQTLTHLVASTVTDNVYIPSTNAAVSSSSAMWLFGGASTIFLRAGFGSSSTTTLTTGTSYANVVIASSPISTFSSGTHAILTNIAIRPVGTITSGGATITDVTSGISYPSTGGSNNWNFWFKGGNTRVSGLQLDTLTANQAVYTDASKRLISKDPNTSLITGTPTIVAGTGAGTSPTVSVTTNGKQLQVTVTTGTLPTGTNATIATVTLPNALTYTPLPVFSSASAATALLNGASMVYMTSTGTANLTITSGTTALTAATTYVWNIAL